MYNDAMVFDPLILIYVLGAIIILLLGFILRLEIKLRRLSAGKNGKSLEDTILEAHKAIGDLHEFRKDSIEYFKDVEKRLSRSIQAVETIRFNPFKGTGEGGSQSFCTTFSNERGDGVVISSLYSRDRVSIFSKPLQKFESTFELTPEEAETLETARKNLQ